MIFLLNSAFLFSIGCVAGYVIELVFRRIVHKRWINPGFLNGPCLPLYGTGLLTLYLLSSIDLAFIKDPLIEKIAMVAAITLAMTVIELITGLFFTGAMKVRLWDYTKEFCNFKGVICLRFSLIWGLVGAAYYFLLHPHVLTALDWFSQTPPLWFFLGIFYGVFAVDIIISFGIAAKIRRWAKENEVVVRYEEFKSSIAEKAGRLKEKIRFFAPFKSPRDLKTELENYFETVRSKFQDKKKNDKKGR